ncbi:TerB family tellurite resistance protein [Robiginitomaculum antarcticum]|uniref:TerB family tellurite resistance protein n=1 Tax=Robiginitomaculum antarcticum TaxID=437507 RepID=UPI00036D7DAE|nr:TerB family tellurite resistance protein [Robiginitomaculum antarcticum]
MSFWTRIFSAAAGLFGPAARPDIDGQPGRIDDAGFAAALIALSAKLAKADGVVTREEIDAFRSIFTVPPDAQDGIARFFDLAKQTTAGFESYAKIVARKFRARPAALEDVMDGLFHIALADGVLSAPEMEFLQKTSDIFGFSDREFNRLKASHMGRAADDPYLILGVDEDISDVDLKRAYRRQAAANHPDRLMARGLPEQFQGLANHKMAMINGAYAQVLAERQAASGIVVKRRRN